MLAEMMPLVGPYRTINYIEAGLWITMGIGVSLFTGRRPSPRKLGFTLAVALVAFGVSDIVEVRTGAWWHPWWMLLWKAACVGVLATCVVIYRRKQARRSGPVS